ncbi:MAG: ORF6N domain-containing protein [Ignavibacteriae bacterium]|nr:ORF6N domain-containing protein [Ignavibacteriota bacterium]
MSKKKRRTKIPTTYIRSRIHLIRGVFVILDTDLAALYEVSPKVLLQSVKRNKERFPPDFMFRLTDDEEENLRSQTVTSSWGGRRYNHYAFTYNGIAMTASVLRSERAIETLKQIMRTFTAVQQAVIHDRDLSHRVTQLEYGFGELRQDMNVIYGIIDEARQLEEKKPKAPMGFVGEPKAVYNARRKKK